MGIVKLGDAFRPNPYSIYLTGFGNTPLLNKIHWVFQQSRLSHLHDDIDDLDALTFSPRLQDTRARQKLIHRADDWNFPRSFLKKVGGMKKKDFPVAGEYHHAVILEAGRAIDTLRNIVNNNRGIQEFRDIGERLPNICCEIEERKHTFESADDMRYFIVDCQNEAVIPLKELPEGLEDKAISYHIFSESPKDSKFFPDPDGGGGYYSPVNQDTDKVIRKFEHRVYVTLNDLIKEVKDNQKEIDNSVYRELEDAFVTAFGEKITQYIFSELVPNRGKQNVRAIYERVLLPKELAGLNHRLRKWYYKHDRSIEEYREDGDERDYPHKAFAGLKRGCRYILSDEKNPLMPKDDSKDLIYPEFTKDRTYKISGLFPVTFAFRHTLKEVHQYVPIDFVTEPGEKNFFLTGLHSGGKTFLEKNLALLHIMSQLGLPAPADECKIPIVNNIYFISQNKLHGQGRFESELSEIFKTLHIARSQDVVFIDELLDSTREEIAQGLLPEILTKAQKCPATVFVCSHRSIPLEFLTENKWVCYTPEFRRDDHNNVIPTYKISRGLPDLEANLDHAKQIARRMLDNLNNKSSNTDPLKRDEDYSREDEDYSLDEWEEDGASCFVRGVDDF